MLDARRRRFEYTGGPAEIALAVHAGGDQPIDALERTIERELNEPFARDGRLNPFRFFCIDNGPWFHLGLAYDHVIAGGDSIVVLLEGIVSRYLGDKPEVPPPRPFDRYPATYGRLLLRHAAPALRGRPVPAGDRGQLPAHRAAPLSRAARTPATGSPIAVSTRRNSRRSRAHARAWGVTVNDLLLAILLRALEPFAGSARAGRATARARHRVDRQSPARFRLPTRTRRSASS